MEDAERGVIDHRPQTAEQTAFPQPPDPADPLYAQRYQREIRMVRAPESDEQTAQHLDRSLARAGAGAVKVAYNTSSMALRI